jgi:hypothetical protein
MIEMVKAVWGVGEQLQRPTMLMTLAHFSVSSAMNLPKPAGENEWPSRSESHCSISHAVMSVALPAHAGVLGRAHAEPDARNPAQTRPRSEYPAILPRASIRSPQAGAACRRLGFGLEVAHRPWSAFGAVLPLR